jgi:hypothetical protein
VASFKRPWLPLFDYWAGPDTASNARAIFESHESNPRNRLESGFDLGVVPANGQVNKHRAAIAFEKPDLIILHAGYGPQFGHESFNGRFEF